MKTEKNKPFFNTLFSKSNIEIIKELQKSNSPLQFKDLKLIANPKTDKKYSTRTISESLKELEEYKIITNQVMTKSKRKTVGYIITEKGKQTFNIIKEAEEKYKKL